jgi:hypothetical protein
MYKKLFLIVSLAITGSCMALRPEQSPLKPDFTAITAPAELTANERCLAQVRNQCEQLRADRKADRLSDADFETRKNTLHAAAAIIDVKLARKISRLQ